VVVSSGPQPVGSPVAGRACPARASRRRTAEAQRERPGQGRGRAVAARPQTPAVAASAWLAVVASRMPSITVHGRRYSAPRGPGRRAGSCRHLGEDDDEEMKSRARSFPVVSRRFYTRGRRRGGPCVDRLGGGG